MSGACFSSARARSRGAASLDCCAGSNATANGIQKNFEKELRMQQSYRRFAFALLSQAPPAFLNARGAPAPLALARGRRFASLPSNLRADVLRRVPAGALAKAGRRSGWQAGPSLGPQAPLLPCPFSHYSE